ncbi:hypothetical protein [Nostoc sp.]
MPKKNSSVSIPITRWGFFMEKKSFFGSMTTSPQNGDRKINLNSLLMFS